MLGKGQGGLAQQRKSDTQFRSVREIITVNNHSLSADNSYIEFLSAEEAVNEDILWSIFAESGRIEDYLRYTAGKEDNHDNC